MGKYEDLIKRLRDSEHEIDCSLCDRNCCYPDGKVHGKCIIIEAADAIEAQDRHILTLQHEMMAEAESHIAEVNRLNKQIEALSKTEKTTRWIPVTERLPKENGRYLVRYVRDIDGVHSDEVRIMWFADAQWRFPFICNPDVRELVTMEKVTHWMPLPEPPKEET